MLVCLETWSSLEAKVIQKRESLFTELKHVQDDLMSCLTQYIIVLSMLCTIYSVRKGGAANMQCNMVIGGRRNQY